MEVECTNEIKIEPYEEVSTVGVNDSIMIIDETIPKTEDTEDDTEIIFLFDKPEASIVDKKPMKDFKCSVCGSKFTSILLFH